MASVTSVRISHTLTQSRPIGEEYKMLYGKYKGLKLSKNVNQEMLMKISMAISNGQIPIIDSCILYYKGLNECIPSNINKAFIIAIDCVRNMEYTEKDSIKNGMGLNEINTFANNSELVCLPSSINLTNLASLSTHSKNPNIAHIPQLCFQIGFNPDYLIGFDIFTNTLTPVIEYFAKVLETTDTYSMNIIQYVNYIYKKYGYEEMRTIFRQQSFLTNNSHNNDRIFRIKYLVNNNNWKSSWNRHTRGTTFYLSDSDEWVPIKYLMQRGCEMMTGLQISNGIDSTESIISSGETIEDKINSAIASTLIFDDEQRKIICSLLLNEKINGGLTLSFKKDGSLLGYTIIRNDNIQKFMREFIKNSSDIFAQLVLSICDKLGYPMGYFSSQSTLLIGVDMQDWTVNALLSTIMSDNDISTQYSGRNYMDAVNEKFPEILTKLNRLCMSALDKLEFSTNSTNSSVTLNFETICRNRRSIFAKNDHVELALSYNSTSCTVLGISMCDINSIKNMPHFTFSKEIYEAGLIEPVFYTVEHTSQVNTLLEDLNNVIFEKISENEFFEKNLPQNSFSNWEKIIDREGFVTYNHNNDYGKIKTYAYYFSHNLSKKNIQYLLNLSMIPSCRIFFPLCNEVNIFYSNINTDISRIMNDFNKIREDTTSLLYNGLPEKALKNFGSYTTEVQTKIIINTSTSFPKIVINIFKSIYPFDEGNVHCEFNLEVVSIMKLILMESLRNTNKFSSENLSSIPFLGELFSVVRKAIQSNTN